MEGCLSFLVFCVYVGSEVEEGSDCFFGCWGRVREREGKRMEIKREGKEGRDGREKRERRDKPS